MYECYVNCRISSLIDQQDYVKGIIKQYLNCINESTVMNYEILSNEAQFQHNISYFTIKKSLSNHVTFHLSCIEVEYILKLVEFEVQPTTYSSSSKFAKVVNIEDTTTPYSKLFEDYVLKSKVFTGKVSTSDQELMIPSIAANNYLWKLKGEGIYDDGWEDVDLTSRWPKYLHMKMKTDDVYISQAWLCPLNLHHVLWNANSSDVTIIIYHPSTRSEFKSSMINSDDDERHHHIPLYYPSLSVGNGIISKILSSKYRSMTIKRGEYIFLPTGYIVSYDTSSLSTISSSMTSSYDIGLHSACLLDASNLNDFVRVAIDHRIASSHVSNLLISMSKADLSMMRSIADDVRHLDLSSLSSSSLSSFISSSSLSSSSNPSDRSNRRHRKSSGQWKDWQEVNRWQTLITSHTIPRPSSPHIIAIGRDNATISWSSSYVPDINDQTVFGFNITVCTLPRIRMMSAIQVIYDHISSSSTSASLSSSSSASSSLSSSLSDIDFLSLPSYSHDCKHHVAYRQHDVSKPNIEKISLYEVVDDDTSRFSATIHDLLPNQAYDVSITTFYSSSTSISSDHSRSFHTSSSSSPSNIPCLPHHPSCIIASSSSSSMTSCMIHFLPPYDDGGYPILGYHIYISYHHIHNRVSSSWRYHGMIPTHHTSSSSMISSSVKTMEVSHLHPNTSYRIRISSYNHIGNGSLSEPSNIITTASGSSSITNDHHHHPIIRSIDLRIDGRMHHHTGAGNHIIKGMKYLRIDDYDETITVIDPDINNPELQTKVYAAWTSHWSPRSHIIEAPCYWTDPFILDTSSSHTLSHDHTYQKIVMVGRGKVPIIAKVLQCQLAGAMAVIIVDDGSCSDYDQRCIPGASKIHHQGFGRLDTSSDWHHIKIPVLFVIQADGEDIADRVDCHGRQRYVDNMKCTADLTSRNSAQEL